MVVFGNDEFEVAPIAHRPDLTAVLKVPEKDYLGEIRTIREGVYAIEGFDESFGDLRDAAVALYHRHLEGWKP